MSFKNIVGWMAVLAGFFAGEANSQSFMPDVRDKVVRTSYFELDSKNAPNMAKRITSHRQEKAAVSVFVYYDQENGKIYADVQPPKDCEIVALCSEPTIKAVLPRKLEIMGIKQRGLIDGEWKDLAPSRMCKVAFETGESVLEKFLNSKLKEAGPGYDLLKSGEKLLSDEQKKVLARENRLQDLLSPDNYVEAIDNGSPAGNIFNADRQAISYVLEVAPQGGIEAPINPKIYLAFDLQIKKGIAMGGRARLLVPVKKREEDLEQYLLSSREVVEGLELSSKDSLSNFAKEYFEKAELRTNPSYLKASFVREQGMESVFFAGYNFGRSSLCLVVVRWPDTPESSKLRDLLVQDESRDRTSAVVRDGKNDIYFLFDEEFPDANPEYNQLVGDMVEKFRRGVGGTTVFKSPNLANPHYVKPKPPEPPRFP